MKFLCGLALMLGAGAVAAAAVNPTLQLLGQEFTLVIVDARKAYTLNEYVPTGEVGQPWTRQLAVTHVPNTSRPSTAIRSLLKSAVAGGLLVNRPLVVENTEVRKGHDVAVVLVFKDPAIGELEYNLHRYVKERDVEGVKVYRYSRHYPGKAADLPTPAELGIWMGAVFKLQLPVHAKPPR